MTISRPTQAPEWASGGSRRVEPDSGEKASGFVQATRSAPRKANWVLGLVADWAAYLGAIIDSNEEHTYQAAKGRVVQLLPKQMMAGGSGGTAQFGDGSLEIYPIASAGGQRLLVDLTPYLRTGEKITTVEVIVDPNGAAAMTAKLWKLVGGGASAPTATQLGTTQSSTGTAAQALDISPPSPTAITRNTTCHFLEVNSGQSGDVVYMISIAFDDPGPRNF